MKDDDGKRNSTDPGMAWLLHDFLGGADSPFRWMKLSQEKGFWLHYADGVYASRIADDLMYQSTVASVYAYKGRDGDSVTPHEVRRKFLTTSKILSVMRNYRTIPGISVCESDFDADPWLLNTTSCVIDLRDGRSLPHHPKHRMLKRIACARTPRAKCPIFDAFLARILPDSDVRAYMLRAFGYMLTGDTSAKQFWVLKGGPNSGKSTLLEVIRVLLGDYATTINSEAFMDSPFKGSSGHQEDLAVVEGYRMIASEDIRGKNRRWDEALLKSIADGSSQIRASRKGVQSRSFRVDAKAIFQGNSLPTSSDDGAFLGRIRIIEFKHPLTEDEIDRSLPSQLSTELPGILNLLIESLLAVRAHTAHPVWSVPGSVLSAGREYAEISDMLGQFLADNCEIWTDDPFDDDRWFTPGSNLLSAYKNFSGETKLSARSFAQMMSNKGFATSARKWVNGKQVRGAYGLRLTESAAEESAWENQRRMLYQE